MLENKMKFMKPEQIKDIAFDFIIITPDKYYDDITQFLIGQGIEKGKIKSIKEFNKEYGKCYCEICRNHVVSWYPAGETQKNCFCPICGSIHRNRFVYHVIKYYTNLLDGANHSVLYFAPERFIKEMKNICGEKEYITVDITPGRADTVADITDLQFPNEHFDYIRCNHVTEHVVDDKKGFAEMERVLKPEGLLIFSVPILWDRETLEDEDIKSDEDRKKYYGQGDHVRYYGRDIVERVQRAGFNVQILFSNEIMSEGEIDKYGCLSRDSVFLCKKSEEVHE